MIRFKIIHITFLSFFLAGSVQAADSGLMNNDAIRVGIQKKNLEFHEVPLEKYVASVLEKEVQGSWPLESLKAQAVATRTYALFRKENPRDQRFDVMADTSDQVFEKIKKHSPNILQAVSETEGEVLEYHGHLLETFFHSCCGGMSEKAVTVWPGITDAPLSSIHPDSHCSLCPSVHWEFQISRKDLMKFISNENHKASHSLPKDAKIAITQTDESGRASQISISKKEPLLILSGTDFRKMMGYEKIKSTLFEIKESDHDIIFKGRGAGHGVGLCQWGAKGMAERGKNYREILEFYYPGSSLAHKENLPSILPHLDGVDEE